MSVPNCLLRIRLQPDDNSSQCGCAAELSMLVFHSSIRVTWKSKACARVKRRCLCAGVELPQHDPTGVQLSGERPETSSPCHHFRQSGAAYDMRALGASDV